MPSIKGQTDTTRAREGGLTNQTESAVISQKSLETQTERRRGRGRPAGATNKEKGLVPKDLADKFLDSVKPLLPKEHYEEMKLAVKNGKTISTVNEAKIVLKLLGPSLM